MNKLVWFRNDLRLRDNETVAAALQSGSAGVYFIYVYDQSWDVLTSEGQPRLGPFRKRFIAESVIELRNRLRAFGCDLIVMIGNPIDIVLQTCAALKANELYFAQLSTFDEHQHETEIERRAKAGGVACFSFQTHTLFHRDDLPNTDWSRVLSFSKFRKLVEPSWRVRPPQPAATRDHMPVATVALPIEVVLTQMSTWNPSDVLDSRPADESPGRGFQCEGGEAAALARVNEYVWAGNDLRHYKETRNGLLNSSDSSKFSPWLALGCLSARQLYAEVRRFEDERERNSSTQWFLYELLWRDHFYFAAARRGRSLFTDRPAAATQDRHKKQVANLSIFETWRGGRTGNRFIDATMTELRMTGWTSNRMRQNAASFLVHDLGFDWRSGARWFETCLIDYDPSSNWGNWSYVAGAGPENQPHIFNVDQQARTYDPDGKYQEYWLSSEANNDGSF